MSKRLGMDYSRRIALLRKDIRSSGLDSLLVTGPTNVAYLSGCAADDSMALITPGRLFFLTDSRYAEEAGRSARGFKVEVSKESAYKTLQALAASCKLRTMGFEGFNLPYAVALKLRASLPKTKASPVSEMVEKIRSVKEPAEVEAISASTRVTRSVLAGALGAVKPGLAEESLARKIETEFLKRGAKPAFDPIVASGKNSSKPHALPGPARIKRDSFVMLDIGCRLRGYCSDMTRTVITGAVSGRFARIYNVVRTAQRMALDRIRDGARASEVDFAARGYICRKGLGKFFGHSLGHGVGMDVHEAPALSGRNSGFLRAGMVMTVEPAVYIRGFGGVRIEDMVLVTERGYEMLTQ